MKIKGSLETGGGLWQQARQAISPALGKHYGLQYGILPCSCGAVNKCKRKETSRKLVSYWPVGGVRPVRTIADWLYCMLLAQAARPGLLKL